MKLEFRKCSDFLSDTLSLPCRCVFSGLMGACGGCRFVLQCADVSALALSATRALFREIALRHLRIDFNIVVLRALRELVATRKLNKWVVDDGCDMQ